MFKPWSLFAISLLVVLTTTSTYAQTQSESVSGRYEREYAPLRSEMKSARRIAAPPAQVFSNKVKTDSKAVFSAAATTSYGTIQESFVNAQSSSPSWPQWAHDPVHSGSINVVGQSPNQILADII